MGVAGIAEYIATVADIEKYYTPKERIPHSNGTLGWPLTLVVEIWPYYDSAALRPVFDPLIYNLRSLYVESATLSSQCLSKIDSGHLTNLKYIIQGVRRVKVLSSTDRLPEARRNFEPWKRNTTWHSI